MNYHNLTKLGYGLLGDELNLAGMKAGSLIESFEFERNKRSLIQYRTIDIEKQSKAKTSLQRAKEFTREMEKLLAI